MNESGRGVLCATVAGLDSGGSRRAPNFNSREDTRDCRKDMTSRTGCDYGEVLWISRNYTCMPKTVKYLKVLLWIVFLLNLNFKITGKNQTE